MKFNFKSPMVKIFENDLTIISNISKFKNNIVNILTSKSNTNNSNINDYKVVNCGYQYDNNIMYNNVKLINCKIILKSN